MALEFLIDCSSSSVVKIAYLSALAEVNRSYGITASSIERVLLDRGNVRRAKNQVKFQRRLDHMKGVKNPSVAIPTMYHNMSCEQLGERRPFGVEFSQMKGSHESSDGDALMSEIGDELPSAQIRGRDDTVDQVVAGLKLQDSEDSIRMAVLVSKDEHGFQFHHQ